MNPFRRLRDCFYDLRSPHHLQQAIHRLRELETRFSAPRERVNVPFRYTGHGHFRSMRPRQSLPEISALYDRILDLKPRRVLEIGTAKGGTLYLWAQATSPDAELISLDLPGGAFGGGYPEARIPFYRAFAAEPRKLHLLRMNSHEPQAHRAVDDLLRGELLDFLFIDGDHTYEGVRADYLTYRQWVRPGGLIALHDILPQSESPQTQVHQWWQELRASHPVEEIVNRDPALGRTIGIGIIRV